MNIAYLNYLKPKEQINFPISKKGHEIKTIPMQNKIPTHFYSCEIINSKYDNFNLRKCLFIKTIFDFSLTTKKEYVLSPLQVDLKIVNSYTILQQTLSKHSFK